MPTPFHRARSARASAPGAFLPLLLALTFFALLSAPAHAQSISVPFIQEFGCSVVQWLKGPLAIMIFILVCVATLVVGMIGKMDWSRIIAVCVIFGILISLGAILGRSSFVQNASGMSACLQ